MRVGLNVEQLLYRSPGGVGRYTAQLAKLLPASGGDEVVAFTARHPREEVEAAMRRAGVGSLRPRVLPLPRPVLYESWHRLGWPPLTFGASVLAGVDVVHAPSVAVPPRGRAPLVVTVHDAAPILYPEAFPRRGLRFHRMGLAAAARRADLVVAVSQAAAAEIAAHTSVPEERIRVVANGVEAVTVDAASAAAARRRLGVDDRPYVLWVGGLEPRKNVGTLVAAMAALSQRTESRRQQGNGVAGRPRLVLAGYAGWLTADLIGADDRGVLGEDLVQLGVIHGDDLWALYAGAAVFAFPSRHEGFGYPVVEAMSQATPVVCADIEVLREVGGDAATYVAATDVAAWADALGGLLGDEAARRYAGAAGVERSRRFGAAASVAATRAVYVEALGR